MSTATATYYYDGQGMAATVTLLQHKLSIQLQSGEGLREVFWYYDQIMKGERGQFLYPGHPQQALQIPSSAFAQELTERMTRQAGAVYHHRSSTLLKVVLAIVIVGVLFYFFAIPRIASALASKVSVEYETRLGEQMFQSIKGSFTVDEKRTALINAFFEEMNVSSKYPIRITVVKDEVANAFAMPGGRIVVYDKLLHGISSYPELAALLSHEYIHVQNRHTLRSLFRQFSSRLFLSLLLGNIDVAGAVLLQNASQLKDLSYSRGLETEADEQGAALLAKRGIDCGGFVRLFQLLQKESNGPETPELVNSHPNIDKRIRNIKEQSFCEQKNPVTNDKLHGLFLQLKTAE